MWFLLGPVAATACCFVARLLSRKISSDDKTLIFMDEFIGQFWSAVFIMELGIIGGEFGAPSIVLLFFVFLHFLLRNMYFTHANKLYDNPVAFAGAYYAEGRKMPADPFTIMGVFATQMIALLTGQMFSKNLWAFLDPAHVEAIAVECSTGLSSAHSWQHAAALEAVGVFILVLVGLVTAQTKFQVVALSTAATALVTVMSYASGLFMNASIATAFSFNCKGHPENWVFLVVYWLAPYVGIIAANELWLGADRLKGGKDKQA